MKVTMDKKTGRKVWQLEHWIEKCIYCLGIIYTIFWIFIAVSRFFRGL